LLAGVGVLVKLHTLFVSVPVLAILALRHRIHRGRAVLGAAVAFLLVAGWWFAWNLHQYGDLTGRRGVQRTGVEFPAEELSPGGLWRFARGVFGYLWTPAEYFRNTVDTPVIFELLAVAITAVAIVGLLRARRRPAGASLAACAIAVAFCLGLAFLYFTVSTLAGRLLYPLAPLYAVALVSGLAAWGRRAATVLVGVTLATYLALAVVMLHAVATLPDGPWRIAL
jgi:hypothetical protein